MSPRFTRACALAAFAVWAGVWALLPELPWELPGCALCAAVLAFASTFESEPRRS